ncbi:hypothetical protein G6F62_014264 [Rhizopus arrhizus]|nr:hypothetical protein G6F23_014312 [Rhizopus arrhizus]KAG1166500.1 hypothetical protein G6F35_018154 [Rhizopus arrhizus]KAG1312419.1 hypothetical protein G6F62_014264 [Rhizopus arrhizus]
MLPRKQDQARIENDMELFMRDIEEDPEFRANINIFKSQENNVAVQQQEDVEDMSDEELPEISLEEMLDEMAIHMDEPDNVQDEDEDMMQM